MPPTPDFDPATAALIRAKAAQMVGQADWRRQDALDLVQDLRVALLRRRPAHDPARSPWPAFARAVVAQAALKLRRDRRAGKRDYRRRRGWDEATFDHWTERRRQGRRDAVDLLLDVAALVARLPPQLRVVADCLYQGLTVAEAARALGVPRTTLHAHLRHLREHFAALAP